MPRIGRMVRGIFIAKHLQVSNKHRKRGDVMIKLSLERINAPPHCPGTTGRWGLFLCVCVMCLLRFI